MIQDTPVHAAQSFNKHDADMDWTDKIGPQYCQGMPVLQYSRLVNIPNTALRRQIKLIKEGTFIKVNKVKGCPSVLSKYQHKFLCGVILRKYKSNNGISPKEFAEDMLVLYPSLTIN